MGAAYGSIGSSSQHSDTDNASDSSSITAIGTQTPGSGPRSRADTLTEDYESPTKANDDDEIITTDDLINDLGDDFDEEDPLLGVRAEIPAAKHAAITRLLGEGNLKTTWHRELRIMLGSTANQMVNFYLTASCAAVSLLFVGHLGREASGATALATMTYNITGLALLFGVGCALDTLASQAYGAGKKHLVGLQVQRVTLLNWACAIPISLSYILSPYALKVMIADQEVARLAGQSLRILVFGLPGIAMWEAWQRYFTCQAKWQVHTYVLLCCFPLDLALHYFFIFYLDLGYIGAPWAVVCINYCMPGGLLIYAWLFDNRDCWGGFSRDAFRHWGMILRLALSNVSIIEAQLLAVEVLTFVASTFSGKHLAAQGIMGNIVNVSFHGPLALSTTSSTRVGNYMGAGLIEPAKILSKVTVGLAIGIGTLNATWMFFGRAQLVDLFTNDTSVRRLLLEIFPWVALGQIFEAFSIGVHGVMRGVGRPLIAAYSTFITYYMIGFPISLGVGIGTWLKLRGLWLGLYVAVTVAGLGEIVYLCFMSWKRCAAEAEARNRAG